MILIICNTHYKAEDCGVPQGSVLDPSSFLWYVVSLAIFFFILYKIRFFIDFVSHQITDKTSAKLQSTERLSHL